MPIIGTCLADCGFTALNHAVNTCRFRVDGIGAIALIDTCYEFADLNDPLEWNAEITAGRIRVIKNIGASLPAGSAVTIDDPTCGGSTLKLKTDFTLSLVDRSISVDNDNFYNNVDGRTFKLALFYCNENEIRFVDLPANIQINGIVSEGQGEGVQVYNVTITWSAPNKQTIPQLLSSDVIDDDVLALFK